MQIRRNQKIVLMQREKSKPQVNLMTYSSKHQQEGIRARRLLGEKEKDGDIVGEHGKISMKEKKGME